MASQIGSDYYPEIMGNLFVVDAPYLFSGIWAVVKGFLDERTRNKIKIQGSGYQKVLLEMVDADQLPSILGGTCTCSHVPGGCMKSNKGPWEDYELVRPLGIRKKGSQPAVLEEVK